MKTLAVLFLIVTGTVCAAGRPDPRVFCADEPEAKAFLENMPERYTASTLSNSDPLYDSWLETLGGKQRLSIRDSNVTNNKYVVTATDPRPMPGWDGAPVQFAAVIAVNGDGDPVAVLIIAASDRTFAKAYGANYLRWKFKSTLGELELRPGIFKTVSAMTFLYTRQTIARDPDKAVLTPPPMQVFAKIIN